MPSQCCIARLDAVIKIQQIKPSTMGLPPVFTNFIMLVLSPIAVIAIIIKNLLSHFSAFIREPGRLKNVVIKIIVMADQPSFIMKILAVNVKELYNRKTKVI